MQGGNGKRTKGTGCIFPFLIEMDFYGKLFALTIAGFFVCCSVGLQGYSLKEGYPFILSFAK